MCKKRTEPRPPMKKGKKVALIITSVITSLVLLVLIVFSGYMLSMTHEIKAMKTVKEVYSYPLYSMDYSQIDYDLDDMINYGIYDEGRIVEYVTKNLLGFPIKVDMGELLGSGGCTSFSAVTPDGDNIFARNFDYEDTDVMVLTSRPKNGYSSVSICDLSMVGYTKESRPDSFFGKFLTIAAIYTPMDGMNEKGVGISVLELPGPPVHQDNGKPDVTTSLMIRIVLDKAANVNEAIALFNSYDMHENDYVEADYHFFLTDASGDSAVVEYVDNQISVVRDTEYNDCQLTVANHFLTPSKSGVGDFEIGQSQQRYDIITNAVNDANGIMTETRAMEVLGQAVMKNIYYADIDFMTNTQWSAVYNLDKLTLKICVGMQYDKVFEFSL